MSIFNTVKTAKEFQGSPYPIPGSYVVQVNRCKEANDRKGIGMFVVELMILASNTDERRAGTTMDWVVKFDKDAAGGNVKTFIKQALNCWCVQNGRPPMAGDDFDLDEGVWNACVGTQNFLAGVQMSIEAYNKKTSEGNDFTRLKWGYTEQQKAGLKAA